MSGLQNIFLNILIRRSGFSHYFLGELGGLTALSGFPGAQYWFDSLGSIPKPVENPGIGKGGKGYPLEEGLQEENRQASARKAARAAGDESRRQSHSLLI